MKGIKLIVHTGYTYKHYHNAIRMLLNKVCSWPPSEQACSYLH